MGARVGGGCVVVAAGMQDVINTIVAADMIGGARNVLRQFSTTFVAPALVDTQAASLKTNATKSQMGSLYQFYFDTFEEKAENFNLYF